VLGLQREVPLPLLVPVEPGKVAHRPPHGRAPLLRAADD
jgi:hypothetical protein